MTKDMEVFLRDLGFDPDDAPPWAVHLVRRLIDKGYIKL